MWAGCAHSGFILAVLGRFWASLVDSWVGSCEPGRHGLDLSFHGVDLQVQNDNLGCVLGAIGCKKIDETRCGDGIGSQKLGLGMALGAKAKARAENGIKKRRPLGRHSVILGPFWEPKIDVILI